MTRVECGAESKRDVLPAPQPAVLEDRPWFPALVPGSGPAAQEGSPFWRNTHGGMGSACDQRPILCDCACDWSAASV